MEANYQTHQKAIAPIPVELALLFNNICINFDSRADFEIQKFECPHLPLHITKDLCYATLLHVM